MTRVSRGVVPKTRQELTREIKQDMPFVRKLVQSLKERYGESEESKSFASASMEENIRAIKEMMPFVRLLNHTLEEGK